MDSMEPHDQLKANVRELTSEHTKFHTFEKQIEGGTVPGLIQQVREAIRVSGDRAGSSGGKPVPLNMPAYTALERITRDVSEALKPWGVRPEGFIEAGIITWAKLAGTKTELTAAAADTTSRWIRDITTLFEPVRTTEVVGKCPQCGWAKMEVIVDGETKIVSTLQAVGGTVTCQSCIAGWTGRELHALKAALDTPDAPVA